MEKSNTLIKALKVSPVTKSRLLESVMLMYSTDCQKRCQNFRFELQGTLNALESEGIISLTQFTQLGEAVGNLWKKRNRSFYLTTRAIEKATA
jgi:hypothetical protein